MARYEDSKADNARDKKGAKKMGMSRKAFEGSAMDRKIDKAGQKALDRKGKKK